MKKIFTCSKTRRSTEGQ